MLKMKYLVGVVCLCLLGCGADSDMPDKEPDAVSEPEKFEPSIITDSLLAVQPYSIQVAAFQNKENAFKLRSNFKELGIEVFIVEFHEADGELYRTYAGPYATPAEVERMLPKIQQMGYPSAFVKIHDPEAAKLDSIESKEAFFIDDEKRQITTVGGCTNPSWSPTGREIAFIWRTGGRKGIYAVGTSGGPLSRIVEASSDFSLTGEFVWSPDGNAVAFIGREFNSFNEMVENLFIMQKKQNKPVRLTAQNRFSYKIENIKWSSDGQYIAFEADYGAADESAEDGQKVFYCNIAEESHEVLDVDRFGARNALVGWESNSTLLYFSAVDNYEWHETPNDALKRFDITQQQSEVVTRFMNLAQLSPIALVDRKYLISVEKAGPGLSRLISFDITNREKFILYELNHSDWFPKVEFSKDKKLFFSIFDKLWQCTVFKREVVYPLSAPIQNFTVSPSGKRICFSERDNLFTVRLP